MASLTRHTLFKASAPRAETPMDKTTRAARVILTDETNLRSAKTQRLRKARLEREGYAQVQKPEQKRKPVGKTLPVKAAK